MNAVLRPHDLAFRHMRETDIGSVMLVEKQVYPHPWTTGIFRDCLRAGYLGVIAENNDAMVGYGMMSVAAGEAHILNLCVSPGEQGKGYGKALLTCLLDMAHDRQVDSVFLEVRVSNRRAQQLYAAFGFNEIGKRTNYYPDGDGREDALVFGCTLISTDN